MFTLESVHTVISIVSLNNYAATYNVLAYNESLRMSVERLRNCGSQSMHGFRPQTDSSKNDVIGTSGTQWRIFQHLYSSIPIHIQLQVIIAL